MAQWLTICKTLLLGCTRPRTEEQESTLVVNGGLQRFVRECGGEETMSLYIL